MSYRKSALFVFILIFFVLAGFDRANAAVSVGINLNFGAPPQEVVAIPGGVYYVPNQDVDIFYFGGYWWAIRESRWYRAHDYNGSWVTVSPRYVPVSVFRVYRTPNYRQYYEKKGGQHLPFKQLGNKGKQGNWGGNQMNRGHRGKHSGRN